MTKGMPPRRRAWLRSISARSRAVLTRTPLCAARCNAPCYGAPREGGALNLLVFLRLTQLSLILHAPFLLSARRLFYFAKKKKQGI
jgi:hypothetical protein